MDLWLLRGLRAVVPPPPAGSCVSAGGLHPLCQGALRGGDGQSVHHHVLCSEGRKARSDPVSGFQGMESLGDRGQSLGTCHLGRGSRQVTQALSCRGAVPWGPREPDLTDDCVDTLIYPHSQTSFCINSGLVALV